METFKLSEKYEASYTPRKVEKGWLLLVVIYRPQGILSRGWGKMKKASALHS